MRRPLVEKSRRLRRNLTPAESKLWEQLRKRRVGGFRFRRQHGIGPYIVDFYCPAARIAIEVDGGQHSEPEHCVRDSDRDRYLHSLGIRVLRFWNTEVDKETPAVVDTILRALVPQEQS